MITLALDASTYAGTVAVVQDDRILAEGVAPMRGRDAERLMPEVEATLGRAKVSLAEIDRIVCGAGPGSFTSLRIAGSLAKGMALGAAKPLHAVPSLALIVAANATEDGAYVAVLDALRGEVFAARFEMRAEQLSAAGDASLIPRSTVASDAVGPDVGAKWTPHARGVAKARALISGPVDLASWEPTYGRLAEAQVKLEAASK